MINLTVEQVLAGVDVLVVLGWVWRAGARRSRAAANTAQPGARLLSQTGRVLCAAGVIVGVPWVVITHPAANPWLLVAVLGPARVGVVVERSPWHRRCR